MLQDRVIGTGRQLVGFGKVYVIVQMDREHVFLVMFVVNLGAGHVIALLIVSPMEELLHIVT
ncbi:MAG: hypothetical protein A2804_02305 [Candidatus Pacebacteria bacterium RIFCSPHIGHO2_01_FULL_46_10]|nr:MAG: hypothetical protein A2804_02305 [Candidatus Pacebacteria bacterium RIFCSPHIGHO2_01_FULL_46_10]